MKVVIPAAGLGSRFADMHLDIPKEMLPLGGTPLIGHALAEAARAGFEAAIVVLSPSKASLRQFITEHRSPLPVEYTSQPRALGIGDAVLRCWRDEPLGVLLPDDVVLDTEHWDRLLAAHRQDGAAALCVRPVAIELTSRFGIAELEGDRVVNLVEKPPGGSSTSNLAILGRYVVNEAVVAGLRGRQTEGELELTFGFEAAIGEPPGVRAVRFDGEIYDCGTPSEYAASQARFPTPLSS